LQNAKSFLFLLSHRQAPTKDFIGGMFWDGVRSRAGGQRTKKIKKNLQACLAKKKILSDLGGKKNLSSLASLLKKKK